MADAAMAIKYNTSDQNKSPLRLLSEEDILRDLELSRQQIQEGKCRDMAEALSEMGREHGFI